MARRDLDDDGRKKSAKADLEQQQEEEKQDQEVQQDQQQQRDAAQDALGNQAVQEMMGVVNVKAGEAGQGADVAVRKSADEIGVDYGGDDVPVDAPITMEDLVRSWNPTTQRGQDKEKFREDLGLEELPPPDPQLVAALGPPPPLAPRDVVCLGAIAVELDPGPIVATATLLAGLSPLARVLRAWTSPQRPPLVDRRVVVARARTLALVALLAETAVEQVDAQDRDALRTFHRVLLELAARRRVLPALLDRVAAAQTQLPLAADLVSTELEGASESTRPGASPSVEQIEHLRSALHHLAPRVSANTLVPGLTAAEAATDPPEDDPLGLDVVLAQGYRADPLAAQYEHLLAAAERLAVATTRTRVEGAAALLAVSSVLGDATPAELVRRAASQLDAEGGKVLQLLVEVARAIQQRAVPPPGVRNGLRRAAKAVDMAWTQTCGWVGGIVAHAVPPPASLALPPLPTADALDTELAEGTFAGARAVLAGPGPDLAVARVLTHDGGPSAAEECHRTAALARAANRPALARLVDLWAVLSVSTDRGRALGQALRVQQEALAVGDDLAFAVVSMTLLDLTARTRPERVRAQWTEACRRLLPLGPTAGLALLGRWSPPDEGSDSDTLSP